MTKTARKSADKESIAAPAVQASGHEEALLDQAVAETFPASDPISPAYEKSLEAVALKGRRHRWEARLRAAAPALLIIGAAGLAIYLVSNRFPQRFNLRALRNTVSDTANRWINR